MANEITTTLKIAYNKNGISDSRSFTKKIDVTGAASCGGVQTIGTTEEAVAIGDVGTKGLARFLNIDATNYIEIGSFVTGVFYPFMKLMPGESAICRLAAVTVYAKANTAAARLDYMIFED